MSNFGRIKSSIRNKILKPHLKKDNKYRLNVNKNHKTYYLNIARVVAKAFLKSDLTENDIVIKKDGNPRNCNVENLCLITKKEKTEFCFKNGYNQRLYYDYYGKKYSKKQLLEIGKIKKTTFENRIKRGWNIYETIEIPIAKNNYREVKNEV